jgi:hypothetical protein
MPVSYPIIPTTPPNTFCHDLPYASTLYNPLPMACAQIYCSTGFVSRQKGGSCLGRSNSIGRLLAPCCGTMQLAALDGCSRFSQNRDSRPIFHYLSRVGRNPSCCLSDCQYSVPNRNRTLDIVESPKREQCRSVYAVRNRPAYLSCLAGFASSRAYAWNDKLSSLTVSSVERQRNLRMNPPYSIIDRYDNCCLYQMDLQVLLPA